jgi:hypothetical protein
MTMPSGPATVVDQVLEHRSYGRSATFGLALVATNGSCWTSDFQTARRNDATHFSATSD